MTFLSRHVIGPSLWDKDGKSSVAPLPLRTERNSLVYLNNFKIDEFDSEYQCRQISLLSMQTN